MGAVVGGSVFWDMEESDGLLVDGEGEEDVGTGESKLLVGVVGVSAAKVMG